MNVRIALYGALREADIRGYVELDVRAGATIAELREHLDAHLQEHAPGIKAGLVQVSAFATAEEILHNHRAVPGDVELAVLPPVSGG